MRSLGVGVCLQQHQKLDLYSGRSSLLLLWQKHYARCALHHLCLFSFPWAYQRNRSRSRACLYSQWHQCSRALSRNVLALAPQQPQLALSLLRFSSFTLASIRMLAFAAVFLLSLSRVVSVPHERTAGSFQLERHASCAGRAFCSSGDIRINIEHQHQPPQHLLGSVRRHLRFNISASVSHLARSANSIQQRTSVNISTRQQCTALQPSDQLGSPRLHRYLHLH